MFKDNSLQMEDFVDFDSSLKKLVQEVTNIGDSRQNQLTSPIPRWVTFTNKFMKVYTSHSKKEGPQKFMNIFYDMFEKYSSEICAPVFDQDVVLQDEWLKPKKNSKKSTTTKVSLKDIRYPGETIYIDEKVMGVSIPISAAYEQALQTYKEQQKSNNISDLIYRFLAALYACFYHSIPEECETTREAVHKNITDIQNVIETLSSPENASGSSNGGIFDKLQEIVSSFTGGKQNNMVENLKNTLSGVLNPENTDKISDLANIVETNIKEKGNITEALKASLDNPNVSQLVNKGQEIFRSGLTGLSSFLNSDKKETNDIVATEEVDASEQD